MQNDEEEIRQLVMTWIEATKKGDTDDAGGNDAVGTEEAKWPMGVGARCESARAGEMIDIMAV